LQQALREMQPVPARHPLRLVAPPPPQLRRREILRRELNIYLGPQVAAALVARAAGRGDECAELLGAARPMLELFLGGQAAASIAQRLAWLSRPDHSLVLQVVPDPL